MPEQFDRCVRKVKAKGGVRNPHAVCRESLKKGRKRKKRKI
jgi:hypothetical protein